VPGTHHASPLVFPHVDAFDLAAGSGGGSGIVDAATLITTLSREVTPERFDRIAAAVAARVYGVLPVVEGCYDMGNLAAVCRSSDALGIGAVHCVMSAGDRYKRSARAASGAEKWLDVRLWRDTAECVRGLRGAGYTVLATHLGERARTAGVADVDWTRPTAFILGNEKAGVSDAALAEADGCVVVPMHGFVESFNISVAASLIMYEARRQRDAAYGAAVGDLCAEQRRLLTAEFLLRGVVSVFYCFFCVRGLCGRWFFLPSLAATTTTTSPSLSR
jgi:tRNA (guanosine-2'-O-)-methyltransferase